MKNLQKLLTAFIKDIIYGSYHCVKSVRIRSHSGPHFPALGVNTENGEILRISPYSVRMWENAE